MMPLNDDQFLNFTTYPVGERFSGWRLDRFLGEHIPKLSRTRLQLAIDDRVRVSWSENVRSGMKVVSGGEVYVGFPRLFEVPEDHQFPVHFEDEDLLVIEKPAGLVVHPTNDTRMNSVSEILKAQRGTEKIHLLHRLDRETSGLLLIAKTRDFAAKGMRALQKRTLLKAYLALVEGAPKEESGWIEESIGKMESSRIAVRRHVREDGEDARTFFKVLARENGRTLLLLLPKTGRRHQLRVHCEFMETPILGDPLYGKEDTNYLGLISGEVQRERMCLHAWALMGRIGDRDLEFWSNWPDFLETSTSLETCARRAIREFQNL